VARSLAWDLRRSGAPRPAGLDVPDFDEQLAFLRVSEELLYRPLLRFAIAPLVGALMERRVVAGVDLLQELDLDGR
jgi:hypothetical protein